MSDMDNRNSGDILLSNGVNGFQAFDELKQVFPELDDIHPTTWGRFSLEVFFESAFVSVLKYNVEFISVHIAAMKFDDAIGVPYATETINFLSVETFAFFGWISLDDEGIDMGIIY
jgi:hypothetical protein